SAEGESFIAGVLEHLPALMALTTPTPNSFKRVQPKFWSGAYKVWGLDNKEAAIRVLRNHFGGGPRQFEIKTVDNSANPYIALTGVISAGLDGLANKLHLPDPIQCDPGSLSDMERESLGVQLLPVSVPEALEKLERDQVLKEALGGEYYRVYTAMRRFEHKERGDYDLEKERSLLLTRY
ncbi:MAG: glutamine synthetase, partial [bacterium]